MRAPHVEAEVHFLSANDGGRATPCTSGYRPQFFYEGRDWDAVHEYPDVAQVMPGDSARALLHFLSPESHAGRVRPGMPFLLREGRQVVGYGVVRRLLGLEPSDRRGESE